tara:strand:- start:2457 stop:3161 length:705 start_codon:yes stop_codon:yes gene_type:complete
MSINNKNILGITLARGGSKGISKKNLSKIGEKRLIDYTIEEAKKSKYIDRYIVSTDSEEIASHCKKKNIDIPFLRPAALATDKASSTDALKHATAFCEKQDSIVFEIVVELMCTNPFKDVNDIDNCIELLEKNDAESVIGVSLVEEYHPARLKKIENGKLYDFCVPELSGRRQDLRPKAYIRNGSIYALSRDYLMHKSLRFGGENSYGYIMPPEKSINIDTPYDLELANIILKK